jgi:hypothetical protein
MRPICVKCKTYYRCKRNDFPFEVAWEGRPFSLHLGDLWECPRCGAEIIIGVGKAPIATRHDANWLKLRVSYEVQAQEFHESTVLVSDC